MSNETISHITDDSFEQDVIKAGTPVLVDFWAPWCGPCKTIAPLLEEVAAERSDVRIVKINIDENQAMAQQYGIRAIPTLLLFENGEVKNQLMGAVGRAELNELLS